jgi:hypothetical protein
MPPDTNTHEPIIVTIAPTRSDFVSFHMRFALGRVRALLFFGVLWLAVILYALYGVPMFAPGCDVNQNALLFSAVFTSVAMVVCMPLGTYIAILRRWNKAPEVREPRQYTFTNEGIQVTGATFAAFTAWSHIVRAGRLAGQVYLGTNQNSFHTIPTATFGDQWERFRALVAERVTDCRL